MRLVVFDISGTSVEYSLWKERRVEQKNVLSYLLLRTKRLSVPPVTIKTDINCVEICKMVRGAIIINGQLIAFEHNVSGFKSLL